MKRACVIGWPIEHSRSPLIHGYWLRRYGIDGAYTKEAVRPEDLQQFLGTLSLRELRGCNVTVPHKEWAYEIVRDLGGVLHDSAKAAGAVNTIWSDDAGRLHAMSTDAHGFMAHLKASVPHLDLSGRPVMVLGAGGAAQSIIGSLTAAGASDVRITNRTLERAKALASQPRRVAVPWSEKDSVLEGCKLLVNTTTLGMAKQPPLEIDLSALPDDAIVYDIVYVPLETQLLRQAKECNLQTVDGLGMLLHQAVPGFEKWFGTRPEVTADLRTILVRDIEGA
jgi:shikimate dehydrogenase